MFFPSYRASLKELGSIFEILTLLKQSCGTDADVIESELLDASYVNTLVVHGSCLVILHWTAEVLVA